jgi:hypothetical protein
MRLRRRVRQASGKSNTAEFAKIVADRHQVPNFYMVSCRMGDAWARSSSSLAIADHARAS